MQIKNSNQRCFRLNRTVLRSRNLSSASPSMPRKDYLEPMRRWRWITLCALAGITLVLALCWRQSEPNYHGKSLSFWLRGFESETMEARWQSVEALRQIGTNALPQIIAQLRQPVLRQEPQWRRTLRTLLGKQSLIKITIPRAPDRRVEALAALDAIGPMAKAAVPDLEALLHENPPDHRALMVLAHIGPEASPALTRALTNDEKVIRQGAQVCLNLLKAHDEFLTPKTGDDAEFMRRGCQFNLMLLRSAFEEYRAQHPEQFTPDGMPKPVLPEDFVPPEIPKTNRAELILPARPPGYE